MKAVLAIVWAGIALLFGLILWAANDVSLFDEFGVLMEYRWFVVTLVDLYLGLILFAGWAVFAEERRQVAAMWIVAFFCLGNLMALAYVLWRARDAAKGERYAERFFLGRHAHPRTNSLAQESPA